MVVVILCRCCVPLCVRAICGIRQAKTIIFIVFSCSERVLYYKAVVTCLYCEGFAGFQQQKEIAMTHCHEKGKMSRICRKIGDRRYILSVYGEIKFYIVVDVIVCHG